MLDKGGAPTKYRVEYIQQMHDYFNIAAGEDVQTENSKGEKHTIRVAANLPTLVGFAFVIGVNRDTLSKWSKKYKRFGKVYSEAKDHQERILVENGLKGGYNTNFAIFTAKNVLGWRDRHELLGDPERPLIPVINVTIGNKS